MPTKGSQLKFVPIRFSLKSAPPNREPPKGRKGMFVPPPAAARLASAGPGPRSPGLSPPAAAGAVGGAAKAAPSARRKPTKQSGGSKTNRRGPVIGSFGWHLRWRLSRPGRLETTQNGKEPKGSVSVCVCRVWKKGEGCGFVGSFTWRSF